MIASLSKNQIPDKKKFLSNISFFHLGEKGGSNIVINVNGFFLTNKATEKNTTVWSSVYSDVKDMTVTLYP